MCEVNYSIQKKKTENSKYIYKTNEQNSQIFIFELIFNNYEGANSKIRRIKRGSQGNVVSNEDNIIYKNVDYIKISILDSNNIKNQIEAKIILDHSATYTTHISNEIYLEFNSNRTGNLECNYNIPQ
jgi:hypothetical protein